VKRVQRTRNGEQRQVGAKFASSHWRTLASSEPIGYDTRLLAPAAGPYVHEESFMQTQGQILSYSSRLHTQREYESVTILKPSTSKAEIADLIKRMRGVFSDRGSQLIKIDNWGMRVLAYPIKHCRKGIYVYWRFLGGSDMVAEFERHMRLLDLVIRFYTVRIDDDVDPNARPSEVTDALVDEVSEPGPDPDELARKAAEEAARRAEEEAAIRRSHESHYGDSNDDEDNDFEGNED
jgi:small subunit ribosomal protein S6